jgi:hypothetical protein
MYRLTKVKKHQRLSLNKTLIANIFRLNTGMQSESWVPSQVSQGKNVARWFCASLHRKRFRMNTHMQSESWVPSKRIQGKMWHAGFVHLFIANDFA